jgi:CDP-glucose 4,6-dehydratase
MGMKKSFWNRKKVFITGHTGFKGSWLSLWLQKIGAEVCGFALRPPTVPSLFDQADVAREMQSLIGDICDNAALKSALCRFRADIVIHLAAQSLVRTSYQHPVETFASNVMGTVNLLDSVRHCNSVHVVLCITSDKCYENSEWPWGYRESDPMGGHDPYSASKGCSELAVAAFRRSFFRSTDGKGHPAAVASARAGNVIGGGDWAADRLVPDIMRAFMAGQDVIIRSPKAIRPWQHVLEPLHGYMQLVENLWESPSEFAEGWNFGPREEDALPVDFLVEQLARLWGPGTDWSIDDHAQLHEAHYLKLDCSKARIRLRWKPRLELEKALEWTVEWYRAFQQQANIRDLTLKQITRYEELKGE